MIDISQQKLSHSKHNPPENVPRIGITMGCPSGIGPEIILRFITGHKEFRGCRPVVIGDMVALERTVREINIAAEIIPWQPENKPLAEGVVEVIEPAAYPTGKTDIANLPWGEPSPAAGHASIAYIETALQHINKSELQGMVTCPVSKSALHMAGSPYPGHTEMLAALCKTSNYGMMMAGSQLKVALVTIHAALADVPKQLSVDEIVRIINLTRLTLTHDYCIKEPRIGVAGLNPHGGEGGLFGKEEKELIGPAVEMAVAQNWQVTGPLPPDTIFNKAVDGVFDAVIAMYHDQGLIPFKLLHFKDGVNVTMGLPIVRTSVDHGTAYDIAGKGVADPASLAAAFFMAAEIVGNRQGC
jgi:4-hydroxythreonine-4-phosphate dehydrogenase